MKNILLITITLLTIGQSSFASSASKVGFYCESNNKPSYVFSLDSDGNVQEVLDGHFSQKVMIEKFYLRNGDIRVDVKPFHPYCSVVIKYVNHTENVYYKNSNILLSKYATLEMSCEGGSVMSKQCTVSVK